MDGEAHFYGSLLFYGLFWLLTGAQNPGFLILGALFSMIGGAAPDILEPPTWPGHRGLLHLFGFFTIIIAIIFAPPQDVISLAISSFCVGYFSHFILDYLL